MAVEPASPGPGAPRKKPFLPPGLTAVILAVVGMTWLLVSAGTDSSIALILGVFFLGAGILAAVVRVLPGARDGDAAERP